MGESTPNTIKWLRKKNLFNSSMYPALVHAKSQEKLEKILNSLYEDILMSILSSGPR